MISRLRLFSVSLLVGVCSNAMAVTGSTTFIAGGDANIVATGYSIDDCAVDNFGSVVTPTLSDGKKICAVFEQDLSTIGATDNLFLVIEGFTSDPGADYFNQYIIPQCFTIPIYPADTSYLGYNATYGTAAWSYNLGSGTCLEYSLQYSISIN